MPVQETLPAEPFITWSGIADPTAAVILIGVVIIAAQLHFVVRQLTIMRRLTADGHTLSRRLEAEKRCAEFGALVYRPDLLSAHLDFLDRQAAVTLQEIRDARNADPGVLDAIHSLLDYYDGIARGIDQGVFSERVAKSAHRAGMSRALRILRPYIEHRRADFGTDTEIWAPLETLVHKWDHDPSA